jgi:hypothetical protein
MQKGKELAYQKEVPHFGKMDHVTQTAVLYS